MANVNANNENTKKAEKQNGQLVELELVLTKHEARRAAKSVRERHGERERQGESEREGRGAQLQASKCYVTFTAMWEKKASGQTRRK